MIHSFFSGPDYLQRSSEYINITWATNYVTRESNPAEVPYAEYFDDLVDANISAGTSLFSHLTLSGHSSCIMSQIGAQVEKKRKRKLSCAIILIGRRWAYRRQGYKKAKRCNLSYISEVINS